MKNTNMNINDSKTKQNSAWKGGEKSYCSSKIPKKPFLFFLHEYLNPKKQQLAFSRNSNLIVFSSCLRHDDWKTSHDVLHVAVH